jgi:hypothetical protein
MSDENRNSILFKWKNTLKLIFENVCEPEKITDRAQIRLTGRLLPTAAIEYRGTESIEGRLLKETISNIII